MKTFLIRTAPVIEISDLFKFFLMILPIVSATPSAVLSKILPTKPSQTTTSTVPLKISLPSTLPAKLGIFDISL